MYESRVILRVAMLVAALFVGAACSPSVGAESCVASTDCFTGERCLENRCVADERPDIGGGGGDDVSGEDVEEEDAGGDVGTPPDGDTGGEEDVGGEERVFVGSVHVDNVAVLESLAGYERITGDLTLQLNDSGHRRIELPELRVIEGSLYVLTPSSVEAIWLPELRSIGKNLSVLDESVLGSLTVPKLHTIGEMLSISQTGLTSLYMPELRTIGGMFSIMQNAQLGSVSLPYLEAIGGTMSLMMNELLGELTLLRLKTIDGGLALTQTSLVSLDLPALTRTGASVAINMNAQLVRVRAEALEHIGPSGSLGGALILTGCPVLEELHLGALETIEGGWSLQLPALSTVRLESLRHVAGTLIIASNAALARLQLDSLESVTGKLHVAENAALNELRAPQIEQVEELYIRNNSQLPTCMATAIRDQLHAQSWSGSVTIGGNMSDGCE